MSKKCVKCGKEWPDEFNVCPFCGGELQTKNEDVAFVKMGDGNAISGGLHVDNSQHHDHSQKDDHSVSDSNNTSNSHNITTTNQHIYNGNYTHIEREKTERELQHEKELKYRECCKKVLADSLATVDEHEWLEDQRIIFGLTQERAHHIFKEISNNHQRQLMNMGTVQRIQFNNFKKAVEGNMVANIKRSLPQIKVIASKFQEDELQYFFHMVLAALEPEECIKAYQERKGDSYWLTFWVSVALHKIGDIVNAENALIDLGKWQGLMPDENTIILGALGYLMDGNKEEAADLYLQAVSNECSPLLSALSSVIAALLNYNPEKQGIDALFVKNRFYLDHFLQDIYETEVNAILLAKQEQKRKEEEERIRKELEEKNRKAEIERKAKEEAERKRREAEERRRFEEEQKKKAEEERKRKIEEERKRVEEAERQRKAAEEQRKLAEERKRLEEEKKAIEEARRKAAEEERMRQIALAEEQRKKKEEKRLAEEAEKKKHAEEARQKQEMRKRAEEACAALTGAFLFDEEPYLRVGNKINSVAKTVAGLVFLRTPEILFMYALCTEEGCYGDTNAQEIEELFIEAGQAGEPLAYICLGELYLTGKHDFKVNSTKADALFEKCMSTNREKQALMHKGRVLIGNNVANCSNLHLAQHYLTKSVQLGCKTAEKYLTEVQQEIAKREVPVVHYCRKCGNKLRDGVKFCSKCGTKL